MGSLDLVETVSIIERKYNVSIDESLIGPETTIGELKNLAVHPSVSRTLPIPRWARKQPVKLLRRIIMDGIILTLFRTVCRLESHGVENIIHAKQPGILAANHTSHLDPMAILCALPIRYRSLIAPAIGLNRFRSFFEDYGNLVTKRKSEYKGKTPGSLRKRILRTLNGFNYFLVTLLFQTFPFPQRTAYRGSLEYTGELLDSGHWILIFPEGEVSSNGVIHRFKEGISVLAEQTRAPVFPVSIQGMNKVLPPGKYLPRRNRVVVSFGKPLYSEGKEPTSFSSTIESAVRTLNT
jgi:1-acyl-sn-glycerol-3-phosphate acyltransferase